MRANGSVCRFGQNKSDEHTAHRFPHITPASAGYIQIPGHGQSGARPACPCAKKSTPPALPHLFAKILSGPHKAQTALPTHIQELSYPQSFEFPPGFPVSSFKIFSISL